MTNIADLRRSYESAELSESASHANPFRQFEAWLQQAVDSQLPDANAMTLATVGADSKPSTRVVLLKGFDERGLVWYTNRESRKGRELAHNANAALQFYWPQLERVVRVEGLVSLAGDAESDEYFKSRPLDSRIGAWASAQSQVLASREELVEATRAIEARFGDDPPRPPHWGGYRLAPAVWEFWQGRKSRLHDRLRYRSALDQPQVAADGDADVAGGAQAWIRERLAP